MKRFRWSGTRREKIQGHISIPLVLDMRSYCIPTAAKDSFGELNVPDGDSSFLYDLVGVIVHEGRSINSGHYTAYCFNTYTDSWINCNDARMANVKEEDVLRAQAYILFYSHREASTRLAQTLDERPKAQEHQDYPLSPFSTIPSRELLPLHKR